MGKTFNKIGTYNFEHTPFVKCTFFSQYYIRNVCVMVHILNITPLPFTPPPFHDILGKLEPHPY